MTTQPQLPNLMEDYAFKAFFSSYKQALNALLKAFLPIAKTISDVEIIDPRAIERRDRHASVIPELYLEDGILLGETKWHKEYHRLPQ